MKYLKICEIRFRGLFYPYNQNIYPYSDVPRFDATIYNMKHSVNIFTKEQYEDFEGLHCKMKRRFSLLRLMVNPNKNREVPLIQQNTPVTRS